MEHINFLTKDTIKRNIPVGTTYAWTGTEYIGLHVSYDSVLDKFRIDEVQDIYFEHQKEALQYIKDNIGDLKWYVEYCANTKQPNHFVKIEQNQLEDLLS